MNKFLKTFSIIVIILFMLSIFSWVVHKVTKGKDLGFLNEPVKFMYSFPNLFKQSVKEAQSMPKTFLPTEKDFKPINKLKKDLIVLTTHSESNDQRSIVLRNLKNNKIFKKWTVDNPHGEIGRIVNPILYPNGSLLYNYYYWTNPGLTLLSPDKKMIWQNDSLVIHHGMNINRKGDIWTCTTRGGKSGGVYYLGKEKVYYTDCRITKYSRKSGKIIFDKSVSEILKENDLSNYLLKSVQTKDPIHSNDIQPALKTTKYYKEDDVFISLRNINAILHYRPSKRKLINFIEGPFVHQHDIDFLNDSVLVMYNNNTFRSWDGEKISKARKLEKDEKFVFAGGFNNNLVTYNLATKEFSTIGDSVFKANEIHTATEGLVEFIGPNTYFVEEQNEGILWVIKDDKVIYKDVFPSQHEGYHHLPNWTRVVKYGGKKFKF